MPSILRSRIALFLMLGAMLIPIGMSSLRGLTHVLTCKEEKRSDFTLIAFPDAPPELLSATRISKDDETFLCGGLSLELGVRSTEDNAVVEMVLPITNHSEHPWQGTVSLNVAGTSIPVGIGQIAAGDTETEVVEISLEEGQTEASGSLLIGP